MNAPHPWPALPQLKAALTNGARSTIGNLIDDLKAVWPSLSLSAQADVFRTLRHHGRFALIVELWQRDARHEWAILEDLTLAMINVGRCTDAIELLLAHPCPPGDEPSARKAYDEWTGRIGRAHERRCLDRVWSAVEGEFRRAWDEDGLPADLDPRHAAAPGAIGKAVADEPRREATPSSGLDRRASSHDRHARSLESVESVADWGQFDPEATDLAGAITRHFGLESGYPVTLEDQQTFTFTFSFEGPKLLFHQDEELPEMAQHGNAILNYVDPEDGEVGGPLPYFVLHIRGVDPEGRLLQLEGYHQDQNGIYTFGEGHVAGQDLFVLIPNTVKRDCSQHFTFGVEATSGNLQGEYDPLVVMVPKAGSINWG